MASEGPLTPTATADVADGGVETWANDANIKDEDTDNAMSDSSGNYRTYSLHGKTYGFAIPDGATVTGIKAEIAKFSSHNAGSNYCTDYYVQLTKASNTRTGDNKANTSTHWGTSSSPMPYYTYGGEADLWGTTWTPSEINETTFGVAVQAKIWSDGTVVEARLCSYRVTIYYTVASNALRVSRIPLNSFVQGSLVP